MGVHELVYFQFTTPMKISSRWARGFLCLPSQQPLAPEVVARSQYLLDGADAVLGKAPPFPPFF
jgi:hypothetical protein